MRRHAKASAVSTSAFGQRQVMSGLALLFLAGLAVLLAMAPAAGANVPGRGFLPDNRGWEKVSLAEKNGLAVSGWPGRSSSSDGNRVFYSSRGAAAPGASSGKPGTPLLATRDPIKGWGSRTLDPKIETAGFLHRFTIPSPDLSHVIVSSFSPLTPGTQKSTDHLYLRDNNSDTYTLLSPFEGAPTLFPFSRFFFAGGSSDYSHLVFESSGVPQTGDAVPAFNNLYEWVDGAVRLVGVLPDGTFPPEGSHIAGFSEFGIGENAVSRDGLRIAFQTYSSSYLNGMGPIYSREDVGSGPPKTRPISTSQRTDCADDPTCGGDNVPDLEPDPGFPSELGFEPAFIAAEAEHGSKILFSAYEKLTDDSTASLSYDPNTGEITSLKQDLYLYDLDANGGTGRLTDVTTGDSTGATVQGVVGASDDLGRIYFVARGVLAPEAAATAGQLNLYLLDQGTTKFVATFDESVSDARNWNPIDTGGVSSRGNVTRTSPDGRFLIITSRAQLTGYDNTSSSCEDGRCSQIYRYDAVTEELTCISCPSSAAAPESDASLTRSHGDGSLFPRNLSDDGSRIYFETADSLVLGDSNGKIDVYQWASGNLALISSGAGGTDSRFVDATPSGSDVFFETGDQLVAEDTDNISDIYDARVDGGFPEPPAPPPACEGDACQSPPSSPNDPTPGSASFSGPSNPRAVPKARCGAGKVRKRGKCVRKRTRKGHSAVRQG